MTDYSSMSTEQLLGLYNQERAKAASGFTAGPSAAPDNIGRRQEYNTAQQQLAKERATLKGYLPTLQSLDQFERTNQAQETGGLLDQVPGLRVGLANLDPEKSQLASLSAEMQVKGVPQGQGAVSDFERALYAQGKPDINKLGGVNSNVINYQRATIAQEQDRLDFMEQYLAANGHLGGAAAAWNRYVGSNPYLSNQAVDPYTARSYGYPSSGKAVLNKDRQGWRQYFGLEAAPAKRQAAPAKATPKNLPRKGAPPVRVYNPKTGGFD